MKTPWHKRMEVARSGLWAPDQPLNYCVSELYSSFDQYQTDVAYMYINSCATLKENIKNELITLKNSKKKTIGRIKTKTKKRNEITET